MAHSKKTASSPTNRAKEAGPRIRLARTAVEDVPVASAKGKGPVTQKGGKGRGGKAKRGSSLPLFAQAMRRLDAADELERTGDRPTHVSTGLPSLDDALRGGFVSGGLTVVAARAKVGATSLLMGSTLHALDQGERVAYCTERLTKEKVRGRLVVLDSRVNGHRFSAGFVSAADRISLARSRERIAWNQLTVVANRQIQLPRLDEHIFTYRPTLVVFDGWPRAPHTGAAARLDSRIEGIQRLASLARRHRVALVLHLLANKGTRPISVQDLGAVREAVDSFDTIITMHRDIHPPAEDTSEIHVDVLRCGGHISRRSVQLQFDSRYAGVREIEPGDLEDRPI